MKPKTGSTGILLPFLKRKARSSKQKAFLKQRDESESEQNFHSTSGPNNDKFLGRALVIGYLILLIILSLSQIVSSFAQAPQRGLQVGDTIPEKAWQLPLQLAGQPANKTSLSLNDYRDKLIILDFWATWCGACIEAFPKMQHLQDRFGSSLKVLLVNAQSTDDTELKIKAFLQRHEQQTGEQLHLPLVMQDTLLSALFPHRYVPHYAWIYQDKVVAITSAAEVDAPNIQQVLSGRPVMIHTKQDNTGFNPKDPATFRQSISESDVLLRSSITRYIEGIGSSSGKSKDSVSGALRYYFFNQPLITLYHIAYPKELNLPDNRILIEALEPERFRENSSNYSNRYCYELFVPAAQAVNFHARMQIDLRAAFNITVEREERQMDVWVVANDTTLEKYRSKDGPQRVEAAQNLLHKFIQNKPAGILAELLSRTSPVPVIDETSFNGTIDLPLPTKFYDYDLPAISAWLKPYGIRVFKAVRKVPVAILKK